MNEKANVLIRYILPALGGLFVVNLCNVVDSIFVGQGVGSAVLSAVNIAAPFGHVHVSYGCHSGRHPHGAGKQERS